MSISGQGHSLTLVKGHSDFKVECLTFGLYTQVSNSGPLGPLVISEHRKSGDRKTSAQSNQKMVFKKIMPHSRVCRNIVCLFEACAIDNANRMIRGKSAQPDQINTF